MKKFDIIIDGTYKMTLDGSCEQEVKETYQRVFWQMYKEHINVDEFEAIEKV